MPGDSSLSSHRPLSGGQMPMWLRLSIGAASGAALSLSFTGLYLSIYSWVCVGVLLFVLFGAKPGIAFACGFFHGLFFVFTSIPWIATRPLDNWRMGALASHGHRLGDSHRRLCVDRASIIPQEYPARMHRRTICLGDI